MLSESAVSMLPKSNVSSAAGRQVYIVVVMHVVWWSLSTVHDAIHAACVSQHQTDLRPVA